MGFTNGASLNVRDETASKVRRIQGLLQADDGRRHTIDQTVSWMADQCVVNEDTVKAGDRSNAEVGS
jgi:hypothetical protein